MRIIKRILLIFLIMIIIGFLLLLSVNSYVKFSVSKNMVSEEKVPNEYDIALVLGAGLKNGKPSPVLKDRLDTALDLYKNKVISKIIVSGDHGKKYYDEVNVMKNYLIENNVLSEDIFMDHAGFSTYDSIYRLRDVFEVKKVVIVTQEFHLYRSLYISKMLGVDAVGVSATKRHYTGEIKFELREILARDKDFVKTIFKPEPKYLGDTISVFESGDLTNDK